MSGSLRLVAHFQKMLLCIKVSGNRGINGSARLTERNGNVEGYCCRVHLGPCVGALLQGHGMLTLSSMLLVLLCAWNFLSLAYNLVKKNIQIEEENHILYST